MKADRLFRQFERSGGGGRFSRLFEEHTLEAQQSMRDAASLGAGEVPLIACFLNATEWVLLTSERLISNSKRGFETLDWGQITDATVDEMVIAEGGAEAKRELDQLEVVVADGRRVPIDLEPGYPFSAFWNVLKLVARSNRSK